MAISTDLQENVVQRAAVTLREKAGLLKGVAIDASPDPQNLGYSVSIGEHVKGDATTVTPSSGNGPSTSEDSFSAKLVSLDTFNEKPVTIDADTLATHNLSYNVGQAIDNAIGSVINSMSEAMNSLYYLIPNTAGTAGQSIFSDGSNYTLNNMATVAGVLDGLDVPEGNRAFIVSNTEAANYRKITSVQNQNQMGNDMVRRTGLLGMDMGFEIAADKRIKTHTVGTITTGLITKASTAVLAGTTSFVATTAASTGACALKKGDLISIAHSSGARTYAVQADVTQASAATDTAAITLDRGLEFALVGSEAVTIATGFGTGTQNIAGDLRGYGLLNRIPAIMASGMTALQEPKVITDPVTGISLLMGYYGQNARIVYDVIALFGVNVVQSDLLVRAQGV